jgi:proteasome beta subunit
MVNMYGFKGTVVGLRCKDGIALASDTRATAAYLVLSKRARKVFKIQDNIGAAISGVPGDVQNLVDVLKAEANLYRLRHDGQAISTKSLAQLASNLLHGKRIFPYIVSAILAGVNEDGPRLFFLDPVGGKLEEEKFASAGTGATVAYGVLEQSYRNGMELKDGVKLAAQSTKRAIERDAATGDKIIVATIDKKGYREIPEKEVEELLK